MGTFKVDKLVREMCKETGGLRSYNSMLSFLILGIKDMNLHSVPMFRQQYVSVNQFNAILWPLDCVWPLAVGVEREGRIVALDIDYRIVADQCKKVDTSVSNMEKDLDSFFSGNIKSFSRLEVNSPGLGEWFGYDGSYNDLGYIKHDKSYRMSHIIGRVRSGDCLVMFYKSDGSGDCIDEVPSEFELPLRYFMLHWHDITKRPTVAEVHKNNYRQESVRLKKFYQSGTPDDWISAIRSNDKSSPK